MPTQGPYVTKQFLEECRKLIRFNSVTSGGNEELASYLQAQLTERGLKTQLQPVTHSLEGVSKRQFNVIGILGDPLVDRKTRKGLLLNTHLDTVGPGIKELWTETGGEPWNAQIKDGKIFGLGSADVKLDFLCKLRAIERFRERKLKQPIYLVGTCGEEMGMFGARYLIQSGALNPKFVLCGEPSELQVIYAHKCLAHFKVAVGYSQVERDARGFNRRIELHVAGKGAHGSYPHLGVNALLLMVDFLQAAIDAGFELRFTRLEGGDTKNKVPDRATSEFFLTAHQFEDFKRFFRDYVRAQGLERSFRVELGGLGEAGVKFLPEPLFSALVEAIGLFRALAQELEKKTDSTYNPAHSTVNLAKLTALPQALELFFDLRLLPELGLVELEGGLRDAIREIAARYPSLNVSFAKDRTNPGLALTPESELVRVCQDAQRAADIEPRIGKKATSTEAAQYFAAGYDAVVFGPGVSHGNSHSPNEVQLVDHLERAALFYEKLIERVCL